MRGFRDAIVEECACNGSSPLRTEDEWWRRALKDVHFLADDVGRRTKSTIKDGLMVERRCDDLLRSVVLDDGDCNGLDMTSFDAGLVQRVVRSAWWDVGELLEGAE
jgi:hypothetical protein